MADASDLSSYRWMPDLDLAIPLSKERLLNLVTVRVELETMAAGLAATRATDGQLRRLEEMHDEAKALRQDDSMLGPANRRFHIELVRTSDNLILSMLVESLMSALDGVEQRVVSLVDGHGADHQEHEALLRAITKRDPAAARELMRSHLDQLRRAVAGWDDSVDC